MTSLCDCRSLRALLVSALLLPLFRSAAAYNYTLLRQQALNGPLVTSMGGACGNMAIGWVRTVFHDFATYDAAKGTGGLDASILTYEEASFADNGAILQGGNIEFFRSISLEHPSVSPADWVALGGLVGLRQCGGPDLTPYFRPGRKSVYVPNDPTLMPDFRQPIAQLTAVFKRMNLTEADMVVLSIGSHSLGSVNGTVGSPGFGKYPSVSFDGTPTKFDNKIWQNAVNATAQKSPLISDRAILGLASAKTLAATYAKDQNAFFTAYSTAFLKFLNMNQKGLGCPLSGAGCTAEQMKDTPIPNQLTARPKSWYKFDANIPAATDAPPPAAGVPGSDIDVKASQNAGLSTIDSSWTLLLIFFAGLLAL